MCVYCGRSLGEGKEEPGLKPGIHRAEKGGLSRIYTAIFTRHQDPLTGHDIGGGA